MPNYFCTYSGYMISKKEIANYIFKKEWFRFMSNNQVQHKYRFLFKHNYSLVWIHFFVDTQLNVKHFYFKQFT